MGISVDLSSAPLASTGSSSFLYRACTSRNLYLRDKQETSLSRRLYRLPSCRKYMLYFYRDIYLYSHSHCRRRETGRDINSGKLWIKMREYTFLILYLRVHRVGGTRKFNYRTITSVEPRSSTFYFADTFFVIHP